MVRVNERRRYPRAAFRAWVELNRGEVRTVGKGRDLSQDGLGLCLEQSISPDGGLVDAEFQLPGIHLPLMIRSRIAWADSGSGNIGLDFVEMDPGLAELIENFVAGRL